MVLALAIPFMGTAGATHGNTDPNTVTLTPESSTAPSGACQTFTATAQNGTAAAEGETIDIQVTTNDPDVVNDATLQFCAVSGGSTLVQRTGGTGTFAADATDEPSGDIAAECFTNASGQCTFGVQITDDNANTTGTVTVFFDADGDDALDANEPRDTSTVAVQPGGEEAAENITCTPATDSNPDGTRHEFQCTVTDAQGRVLPDVTVTFDVTAGPNAEEVGPTNCGQETNQSGQTVAPQPDNAGGGSQTTAGACGYNDTIAATSPPGTDTITAFVNQAAQAGQPAPTTGPNTGEPQVTISKTWTGPARTINCEPEAATNPVGSTHTVTCTTTDINGQPVSGVTVTFSKISGPGTAPSPATATTDSTGTATTQISTTLQDPTGTSVIRGQITAPGTATTECARAAGSPTGSTAGVCIDDVNKTWTRSTPTPDPEPQCNNSIDDDGDGRVDFPADPGCAGLEDNTESPNPGGGGSTEPKRVASSVSYRYDADGNAHKGSVSSRNRGCMRGRKVTVKRVGTGAVGSDRTNRAGNYSIRDNEANGRYFAKVARKRFTNARGRVIICLSDRSPTVRVSSSNN